MRNCLILGAARSGLNVLAGLVAGRGVLEDPEVTALNEDLLATQLRVSPELSDRLASLVQRRPFRSTDPRFCYTLPAWRPYLHDTSVLCVYREPAATAFSILRECRSAPGLRDVSMSFARGVGVWMDAYEAVLRQRVRGRWLFLHLEEFLGSPVDRSLAQRSRPRSVRYAPVPWTARKIYRELQLLSGFSRPLC